jgi:hypothetical protein
MRSQPIVVGKPIIATVYFVPNLFLKTPERAVANEAPKAIIATTQANWLLVTFKPSPSLLKREVAAGLDHPKETPKMKAPPYAEILICESQEYLMEI